jgi:hypothetical protein
VDGPLDDGPEGTRQRASPGPVQGPDLFSEQPDRVKAKSGSSRKTSGGRVPAGFVTDFASIPQPLCQSNTKVFPSFFSNLVPSEEGMYAPARRVKASACSSPRANSTYLHQNRRSLHCTSPFTEFAGTPQAQQGRGKGVADWPPLVEIARRRVVTSNNRLGKTLRNHAC